eukprot:14580790-Alexandrium_andersonii.AAC.1
MRRASRGNSASKRRILAHVARLTRLWTTHVLCDEIRGQSGFGGTRGERPGDKGRGRSHRL